MYMMPMYGLVSLLHTHVSELIWVLSPYHLQSRHMFEESLPKGTCVTPHSLENEGTDSEIIASSA